MRRTILTTALVAVAAAGATLWWSAAGLGAGATGGRKLSPLPGAAPLPEEATWVLRSDRKVDGRVEDGAQEDRLALRVREDVLTGQYAGQRAQGKENGSRFSGEVTRSPAGAPLLTLRQVDQWYSATYAGRLVGEGRFAGCWFDSDGRAGDFELVVEQK